MTKLETTIDEVIELFDAAIDAELLSADQIEGYKSFVRMMGKVILHDTQAISDLETELLECGNHLQEVLWLIEGDATHSEEVQAALRFITK